MKKGIRNVFMFLLLIGVLLAEITISGSAITNVTPQHSSVIDTSSTTWWAPGIEYPRLLLISHSADGKNGTLLATCEQLSAGVESYKPGYPIFQSEDNGKTWKKIAFVQDNDKLLQSEWMPTLFELSKDCGEYKAGTIFLAACSVDGAHSHQSAIKIYTSTDGGASFSAPITVASSGGIETGVWEPFLVQLDDGRLVCYYSDCSEHSVHSQKIVYKVSSDGIHWGKAVDVVASTDPADRPGMPVVTRLGDGRYFMVYEVCNDKQYKGNPVTCRYSDDGLDWGDASVVGREIVSISGSALGSAPYCAWTPIGGKNGILFVSGTFMREGYSATGTDYFVSYDYGETFDTVLHPIPYDTSLDHGGYSNSMIFSKDGKILYAINNPRDPNVADHAKLVFAAVELEKGVLKGLEAKTKTNKSSNVKESTEKNTQNETSSLEKAKFSDSQVKADEFSDTKATTEKTTKNEVSPFVWILVSSVSVSAVFLIILFIVKKKRRITEGNENNVED